MQTTEACPFLPSPYTHHPMKAGATALQNYIATLDYLFISYSSLHCINFLLTNQALLLEKTVWLFLLDKCIYSCTDPHRQLMCYVLERKRELLAPSRRLLVNTAVWVYYREKKIWWLCSGPNYAIGYWSSGITLVSVAKCNAMYLHRTEWWSLISPLFPAILTSPLFRLHMEKNGQL